MIAFYVKLRFLDYWLAVGELSDESYLFPLKLHKEVEKTS